MATIAPRFAIPQISRRITTVRPRHLAPFSSLVSRQLQINSHDGVRTLQLLVPQRSFSSTPIRPRDHHFDTLKFVQRLKDEGFTEEQAEAMMKVLSDVIEER
jgi:hypothetical protein